ncbi:hypothetical protein BC829DRAFT_80064 [Chytridium lagenaria]|nr:hypothetical protein BC829DRAFT_80064 [Chytridium lagenaria]
MASAASSSWFFGRRPSLGTPSASSQCNPSHASSSSQHDTSSPAYSHSNPSPGKRTPTSIPPSSLLSTSPADYSGNPGAFNDEDMRSPPPDFHDAYEEYPFVEDALKVPSFSSGMASPPSPLSHPSQHRPEPWSPLTMDLPPRSPPNPSLETAPMHPPQGQLASPSHSSASSSSVDVDRGRFDELRRSRSAITLTPWNKPSPIYLRGLRRSHEQLGSRPRRSESGSTVGYGDFSYRHPPNERIDEREQAASRHSVSRYSGSPAVSASLTQVHVEGMLPRTDASYESFGSSSGSSVSSSERRSHWNLDPANSSHGAPREMITASPSSSSASRKKSRQQPTSSTSSTAASTPSSSSSRKLNSRRSWHSDYRPPLVPSLPSPYLYGYPYDHAPPIRQSSRYPP